MTQESTPTDTIETLLGAKIQHGKLNRRIYLMKLGDADPDALIPELEALAEKNSYSKIFAKIPAEAAQPFEHNGYQREAEIPNFYGGKNDAVFLGEFRDPDRKTAPDQDKIDEALALAKSRQNGGVNGPRRPLPEGAIIRVCTPEDTKAMSVLYATVFDTYPFPIDDPEYLRETMETHVVYFCVEKEGHIIALSSAEMDEPASNVEMTDFATHPDWLGHGLAVQLLDVMEDHMTERGICTAYTIARAISPGMNITFAKLGYQFGGCLVNNTNISGRIESMNIWHKPLASP